MMYECGVCKKMYWREITSILCFYNHEDYVDFFYKLDGGLDDLPAICEMANVKCQDKRELFVQAGKLFHLLSNELLLASLEDGTPDADTLADAFIMITRLSLVCSDEKEMRENLLNKVNNLKEQVGMV